jgi:hypothetical protein
VRRNDGTVGWEDYPPLRPPERSEHRGRIVSLGALGIVATKARVVDPRWNGRRGDMANTCLDRTGPGCGAVVSSAT